MWYLPVLRHSNEMPLAFCTQTVTHTTLCLAHNTQFFHYSDMSDETMKSGNSCYSSVRSVTTSSIQTRTPISHYHHNQMLLWWSVGSPNKRTSVMAAEEHIIPKTVSCQTACALQPERQSTNVCDVSVGTKSGWVCVF